MMNETTTPGNGALHAAAHAIARSLACAVLVSLAGCRGDAADASKPAAKATDHATAPPPSGAPSTAPTNRVDIPAPVRRNLGITFAKAEDRNVERTLRLPGRFELLPTARRESRAPVAGHIELLVEQYGAVKRGMPLYRIESPDLQQLAAEIEGATARVASMVPLRQAHRVHEESLEQKVDLWKSRLVQLEEVRAAGGAGAAQITEARATLNATQAELAEIMEKDADLEAQQLEAGARLRSLRERRAMLVRAAGCDDAGESGSSPGELVVCATADGVVESIDTTQGGLVEAGARVVTLLQPSMVRFRARGLQSDLGRLREGSPTRVVPPAGLGDVEADAMEGALSLGPTADADGRTLDIIVQPSSLAPWVRAGVSANLEVVLEGGRRTLAIPLAAVVRDGARPVIFRRDPKNPDRAIRLDADLGASDGRWIAVESGLREGDEVVVGGAYQLMLATSGSASKGGHFHADGTFHEEGHD
jgi:hypothetical protein